MAPRKPSKNVSNWFSSGIDRLSMAGGITAGAVLILLALSMGYEVFMRYLLNNPTIWVWEVSHYLLALIMTCGLAYALKTGAHISVRVVRERVPYRWQLWLDAVTALLTVFIAVSLLWTMFIVFKRAWDIHQLSNILRVPMHLPQIPCIIGLFIFSLMTVLVCWRNWRKALCVDHGERTEVTGPPKTAGS